MGWLWGSNTEEQPNTTDDPLRGLDPSLRAFLEKESPIKYPSTPGSTSSSTAPHTTHRQEAAQPPPSLSPEEQGSNAASKSLFTDGRYADLWKTYKPIAEVENAAKTDQEKLLDVLDGFKERKASIGRAALENCALEQWAVNDCFNNGQWKDRMTMCRAENRSLERCYTMQSRFLKALGYLSTYDRPASVDEDIQMHADTLYHRMLAQEKAVEEAKAAGLPLPTFTPILISTPAATPAIAGGSSPPLQDNQQGRVSSPSTSEPPMGTDQASDDVILPPSLQGFPLHMQKDLKKRLKGLTPQEREWEERAIAMEIAAGRTVGQHLNEIYDEASRNRQQRREEGRETVGDKVRGWFGT